MADGERLVIVLMDILTRVVAVRVASPSSRKAR